MTTTIVLIYPVAHFTVVHAVVAGRRPVAHVVYSLAPAHEQTVALGEYHVAQQPDTRNRHKYKRPNYFSPEEPVSAAVELRRVC